MNSHTEVLSIEPHEQIRAHTLEKHFTRIHHWRKT